MTQGLNLAHKNVDRIWDAQNPPTMVNGHRGSPVILPSEGRDRPPPRTNCLTKLAVSARHEFD